MKALVKTHESLLNTPNIKFKSDGYWTEYQDINFGGCMTCGMLDDLGKEINVESMDGLSYGYSYIGPSGFKYANWMLEEIKED